MTYLKDLMKKRKNIKFFKQDVFPTKEEVNDLLKDAHNLVPQKIIFINFILTFMVQNTLLKKNN